MWKIADEVLAEAAKLGIRATALTPEESARLQKTLVSRYTRSRTGWPLWDGPGEDVSVQDASARNWIAEYVGPKAAIVVWAPDDERQAVRFEGGGDVVRVAEELNLTELYVTDAQGSYALCFNHHDYLIAFGDARAWLRARAT